MIIMETERLLIRQQSFGDLAPLHQILSDPITMSFWPTPFTLAATQAWLERNLQRYAEHGWGRWAVVLKQTGALIGDCGIMHMEVAGVLEYDLGYIIDQHHWRQGYASESAAACRDYAASTLGLRRLVANMPTQHVASARVAEKIGMTWEKTFNNPKNRNLPTHLYALSVNT